MSGKPDFRTAKDMYDDWQTRERLANETHLANAEQHDLAPSAWVVAPVAGLKEMKAAWNSYLEIRGFLLQDEACFDVIEGSKVMNRTGATRLATAFGLSIAQLEVTEGRVQDAVSQEYDYRFIVKVRVRKGPRFVDGIGSCRVSEIPGQMDASRREHFAITRAWTRASKRAIADIVGGTEAE